MPCPLLPGYVLPSDASGSQSVPDEQPYCRFQEYQYCYLHIFGFDANDEAKLLGINPASVRMKRTRIYQEVQLKHDKETFLRDYIIKNLLK